MPNLSTLSDNTKLQQLTQNFKPLLDYHSTLTKRGTFYASVDELAEKAIGSHLEMLYLDRGVYAASLLTESTVYSRQLGLYNLLSHKRLGQSFMSPEAEQVLCNWLADNMPPQKTLEVFLQLRKARVNNHRARTFMLRYIFSQRVLTLALKYRRKVLPVLEHCWGKRNTDILSSILAKTGRRQEHEPRFINRQVVRYATASKTFCVEGLRYIFRIYRVPFRTPLLGQAMRAREDLEKGRSLPPEVLMGIRSTYHKDVPIKRVYELSMMTASETQRLRLQRVQRRQGIEDAKFNPERMDLTSLYVYAYNMSDSALPVEVEGAVLAKERQIGAKLPRRRSIGIVLDRSRSMIGARKQQYRPIAIALGICNALIASAEQTCVPSYYEVPLPQPHGATSLARGLLEQLRRKPDVVYILSDGYENAPEGQLDEVLQRVRALGITTPVYQINPVAAAEVEGVRALSPQIPVVGVSSPEALPEMLMKHGLDLTTLEGIEEFLRLRLHQIFKGKFPLPAETPLLKAAARG